MGWKLLVIHNFQPIFWSRDLAIQPFHAIDDHVALGVCGGNVAEADDGLAVLRRKPFVMADGHDAAVAQAGFPRAREIHADITTCSFCLSSSEKPFIICGRVL